jgi:hypothetical protein
MNKLVCLPLVLAACSSSGGFESQVTDLQAEEPQIDRAQFDTASSIPDYTPPAVSVNLTDAAARKLYADTLALPELNPSVHSCPANFGITYSVVFSDGGTQLATASITPAGCQVVTLTSKTTSVVLSPDADYWPLLAADLGITETQIYPYAPPNR